MNITPTSLWRKIVDEVNDYFGFRLEWYVNKKFCVSRKNCVNLNVY